jgi:transposase-like protein
MGLDLTIWFIMSDLYNKHRRVSAFIINETIIQIGVENFWLWICIEPVHKTLLGIYISFLKNEHMFVAENFIHSLVDKNGRHTVYSEMVEHGIRKHVTFSIKT